MLILSHPIQGIAEMLACDHAKALRRPRFPYRVAISGRLMQTAFAGQQVVIRVLSNIERQSFALRHTLLWALVLVIFR
jgi:hypothetical protein